MDDKKNEQWIYDVQIMARRLATLYYYMVNSMLEDLSEEQTEAIVRRAVRNYGHFWGEYSKKRVKDKGMPLTVNHYDFGGDMPSQGLSVGQDWISEDQEILQCYKGCVFAQTWKELNFEHWGRMYCYVDYAKYEAYDPELKTEHQKNELDGDDCCILHVTDPRQKSREKPH